MRETGRPYTIDEAVIKRFDPRRTVFSRIRRDSEAPFYQQSMYAHSAEIIARGEEGRSRLDYERAVAAWTVHDYFRGAFGAQKLGDPDTVMSEMKRPRHEFSSPEEGSEAIKSAALSLGACLAGVAKLNPLWLYSCDKKGEELKLPEGVEHALVMCVPMNRDMIKASPGYAAAEATGRGYSMMSLVAASMAELIRCLGYRAISCGNGTALSLPLAVDAGLGVMGRSGMLLTEEFGPFVRICKVFTDLPLAPDTPKTKGAEEFCKKCGACARKCPAGAISRADQPSYETPSPSNNPGIMRWPVNADKCYCFWVENGADCSTCIAVCPYGKR